MAEPWVEVFRNPDPSAGRYITLLAVRSGETLTASSLPGVSIPAASIFD